MINSILHVHKYFIVWIFFGSKLWLATRWNTSRVGISPGFRIVFCAFIVVRARVQFFTVFAGAAGVPFPMISLFAFNQHCEPATPRCPLFAPLRPNPHSPAHYHLKRILFGFVFGCCLLLSYEDFYAIKNVILLVLKHYRLLISVEWWIFFDIQYKRYSMLRT